MRPVGRRAERRDVEVRVQHLAEGARDRRRRHQQDVRGAAAGLVLQGPALLHPEPVLLVDDREGEVRERDRLLEQRVGPDHDLRLARPDRLERPPAGLGRERAREQRHADPEVVEQARDGLEVLAREEVRRREQRGLAAAERGRGERPRGHGRLARADVALDEAEHRDRAREVVPDLVDRRGLVRGERDVVAELPAIDASSEARTRRSAASSIVIGSVCDRPRARRRPTMPSWSASSSSNASRRSAPSRCSNVTG